MPLYRITAPNGQTYQIEGPEGASDADVASAVMAQYPEAGTPRKQSTIGSELKRGAQQVASSMQTAYGALTGSPEEAAKAGIERGEAINQVAGEGVGFDPVKKAYQEKGLLSAAGEAVSQIPRALAGQGANLATMAGGARLGATAGTALAGPVGGVVGGALGAGAAMLPQFFGSNVERQAAEQMEKGEPVKIDRTKAGVAAAGQAALEGAGTAFTLGKGVVKGILGIADDAVLTSAKAAQQLEATARRSLAASAGRGAARGVVGEMPVEVAQQVIERAQAGLDLTSPDAMKEYGEAAYQAGLIGGPLGGAGNVVTRSQAKDKVAEQAKAAKAAEAAKQAEVAAPGPQIPAEAPAGTQGTLFSEEEMGKRVAPPAEPVQEPQAKAPEGQQDLNLDYQREYADLAKERERLKQQEQTAEVKARIAELGQQMALFTQSDIESIRAEKEAGAQKAKEEATAAKRFPALATAPDLLTQPDEVKARTQGELFPDEDLGVAPTAEPVAEPTLRSKKEQAPKQLPLGLRRNPEGQPTAFGEPEPTITSADIMLTAVPVPKGVEGWLLKNVVGSTPTQLNDLIAKDPTLVQGNTPRAKILRSLTAKAVPAFEEAPSVKPTPTPPPAIEQGAEPRAGKPSVGVPSEPQPAPARPAAAAKPVTPDGRGLVPVGQPAVQGNEAQGAKPAAVTPPAPVEVDQEEAARKAEAEDFKRRLEEVSKPKPIAPAVKQEAPVAKKEEPSKPIPEKLYEPVGTSEFGMEEGEKEIVRGPQAMLFPMSKREEIEYAERPKAAPEEQEKVGPAPKAPKADKRQMSMDFKDTEWVNAAMRALAGKDILEAANWAAINLPDADQKMIAKRVAATLRELKTVGVSMGPLKVTDRGQALVSGARGTTVVQPGKGGGPSTVRVTLNHPTNGDQSGLEPDVLLHELVHAATMGATHVGNKKSAANTRIGKTVSDLYDVANAVFAHVDAKHSRGEQLNEVEKKLRTPYMRDVDEILAWTMTDRKMQEYMESVPYKGSNLWTKFVEAVRNVLGLTPKADTALSEILRIGGELTELSAADLKETTKATGKQFAMAPGTEALIDSMGPLDAEQKSGLKRLIDGFKTQSEVSYATKFRTQTADAAATIEHRLREKFDGAVRDSLGKFNPMGLYRQAQDHAKVLLEYFQQGSLVKDKTTGLWRVDSTKGVRPPAEVYALIDKWAEKNGYTRERATQLASRILEGVRLDAMRTSNKTEGTEFLLHLKDAEIDQLVREYKADPDLQAMSKAMDEARLAMVDNMVAVGRLSAEQGKAWKDAAGYVPFDRLEDFAERFSKIKKISNKGLAQVGKLPELVGSIERPVGNVFDNYLNTLGWMVGQTMKTDASVQTLRSLEDLGHAKFLGRSALGKANTVGMYVDGEMMYWELPSKYDLMAFKDLNPPKAGWLRNLGAFSNVLRKSVTVLPPFALKQVTDDVQRAILTSGVKSPGALLRMSLTNFPKLALAELRGIQHPMVREFGALGLTGEYDFQAGKPATSLLKDLGYKKRGKFETLIHRLDGITRASDLSVRKAIYDQTLKETNDQLLAQTRAREFINFRRRGASDFVGAMVTTIPFFNAYIQGMDVLYRAASGKDSSASVDRAQARRLFWSRALTVSVMAGLYALGKDDDDEDYKEMDLRVRDGNWILPGGYKIPVPGELGAIFKVIPERVVEYMKRQGTPEEQDAWEATRTALTYMFEQYLGRTNPIPQAAKPLFEAWANKSFLTGRELVGIHQQTLDPSQQRNDQTSELAVAIANFAKGTFKTEVSPILIDNALRGYFGSTAALLTATTDSLLNPTRVDRPLHKWALVSNYMYDPVGTRRMTEFYDEREKVGKAGATLRELLTTDLDKAAAYAEEHADELQMESVINSTLQQLENTRAYRKHLNSPDGAKEMSADDREAALKEIKQIEVQLVGWLREAKTAMRQ